MPVGALGHDRAQGGAAAMKISDAERVTVVMVGGPFNGRQRMVPTQQWRDYHSYSWCFQQDGTWSHYRAGELVNGTVWYRYVGRCRHGLSERQPEDRDQIGPAAEQRP